jgi:hydrogenase-4 component A
MANRFVIANPNYCLGCYTCMAACAFVHKENGLQPYPRLYITYTSEGTMPIQCRHCEDAPCANVCPVGAIKKEGDAIIIDEKACIGCKTCLLACPFGAIDFLPQYDFEQETFQCVKEGNNKEVETMEQKIVAVKCDLCYFREEGPACVQFCPTKALKLVKEEETRNVIKNKRVTNVERLVSVYEGKE